MRRETGLFRHAAIEALALAIELFNRPSPTARDQAVLVLTGIGLEKLLKAIIYEREGTVVDVDGNTMSLLGCINRCRSKYGIIADEDLPSALSIKQQRDAAAHSIATMSEEFLWLHVQSSIGLIDRLLASQFKTTLSEFLPSRIIPISAHPPNSFTDLINMEMREIGELLGAKRRQSALAGTRLLPLLNLDASATGRTDPPTPTEVRRAQRLIRQGQPWQSIFPGLGTLVIATDSGDGVREVRLRIAKDGEGLPVRRAKPGEEHEALLYRGVSTFEEFGIKLSTYGQRLGSA